MKSLGMAQALVQWRAIIVSLCSRVMSLGIITQNHSFNHSVKGITMHVQCKKIAAMIFAGILLSAGAETVSAQNHRHAHDSIPSEQLMLNNGKKWATDDVLRQSMSNIRDDLSVALPAIHSGKTTPEQYRALAQKIHEQIASMLKNCKLEQKADATLHLVLTDIIAGADAMVAQDGHEAHKGVEKILLALDNYGVYFDHPGWYGIKLD